MHDWQQFIRHPIVWINLILAAILNIGIWAILLINITPSTDLIVLHYTLYFGVDMIGKWRETLLIPVFGIFLILLNTLFAQFFFKKSHIISYFFLILIPIFQSLLLFATIFLIIANLPAEL